MNCKKFRGRFLSVILAAAMLVTLFPVSVFAAEPDTTPPAFSPGYPRAGSLQTAGSRQVRVVIGSQEASYYSYVLLPDGAAVTICGGSSAAFRFPAPSCL